MRPYLVCSQCKGKIAWSGPRIVVQVYQQDECTETRTLHPECGDGIYPLADPFA